MIAAIGEILQYKIFILSLVPLSINNYNPIKGAAPKTEENQP